MSEKAHAIYHAFDGKLVGREMMKRQVCEVLTLMEDEIVHYVTKNCWFFSSMDDAWAFTLTGNDLKDQHLILLSDELLAQPTNQIRYSIAHEIGHVILKHRNSMLERQTKREIGQQEKEADLFARKYIQAF